MKLITQRYKLLQNDMQKAVSKSEKDGWCIEELKDRYLQKQRHLYIRKSNVDIQRITDESQQEIFKQ